MPQAIPTFAAAPAIDRTYQAVDSSVLATTTVSPGGRPAAVRVAAEADTDTVAQPLHAGQPMWVPTTCRQARYGRHAPPVVERAGIIRTARKLMDGVVFPGPAR